MGLILEARSPLFLPKPVLGSRDALLHTLLGSRRREVARRQVELARFLEACSGDDI